MNEKQKRPAEAQNEKTNLGTQLSLPINEDKTRELSERGRDFEETLSELEKVVQLLEGEIKLEEALRLFDRGMQLSQHCESFLKSAEQRIEILKKAANGTLVTEKFNEETLPGN